MAKASVLAASLKRFMPEVHCVLVLLERDSSALHGAGGFDKVVLAKEIGLPALDHFLFRHFVMEASTAIKATCFKYFFATRRYHQVIYLDPDIEVFSRFSEVFESLDRTPAVLTPHILARAVYYDPDSYTETGAGGANLHIDGSSMSIFELGAGIKAGWELKQTDGSVFKPQLRAGYRYDLVGDRIEDTATFTGGGGAITVEGPDPARGSVNLGTTLKLEMTNNWDFMASYDFDAREDYKAHAGFIRASYKF